MEYLWVALRAASMVAKWGFRWVEMMVDQKAAS